MRWVAMTAGRRLTRCVLPLIALYFMLTNAPARRASAAYLARVLAPPVRWTDVYRHIHHFASTVLDRVYFLQDRDNEFEITSVGGATVHALLDRGEGVLLIGAHLGSFEALRTTARGRDLPVAMLMFEDNARLINATLAAIAPHAQLKTIALGRPGAMLALRRWLDDGGLAGLLADRTLPAQSDRSRTLWLDFLGRPARFSDGPFRLAAILRRPVYFMTGLYHGGRRYEVRFIELADFRPGAETGGLALDERVTAALKRYVALLDSLCREAPLNWFNFYDFWADAPTDTSTGNEHARR